MKKFVRYTILMILLLAVLSVCGAMVLGIYGSLLQVTFDNILFSGFKVGFIASVIMLTGAYLKRNKA